MLSCIKTLLLNLKGAFKFFRNSLKLVRYLVFQKYICKRGKRKSSLKTQTQPAPLPTPNEKEKKKKVGGGKLASL